MPRGDTQARNHPRKGTSIKVEPIRDLRDILEIKECLMHDGRARDYCLFTLGINTAFRASDLLSLTIGQVEHLETGDLLEIKEKKTGRHRAVTLNRSGHLGLVIWLREHPARHDPDAPLFLSQRRHAALSVSSVNHLVKQWCRDIKLPGKFGSHTLRKTWGYHQRKINDAPVPLLMRAFGHRSEAQTLAYLHIQNRELRDLFLALEL
ncbi:MAG: tyrosine-type recombinase/integrase [Candidatus Thiodiazotropha sp.]